MKIAIGTDHAGFDFKNELRDYLASKGHELVDEGAFNKERSDYPDYAKKVGEAVVSGKAEAGILVCGAGIGMSIAANKIKGVRAALCHDLYTGRMSRAHNNANILVLPARIIAQTYGREITDIFLATPFEGERHLGRLKKIEDIENQNCQ